MGRVKRMRNRKKLRETTAKSTDDINTLMQWMGSYRWKNTSRIKCKEFDGTGRGVTSSRIVKDGDILIEVPYRLLITYSTVCELHEPPNIFKLNQKLKIHDLLAVFLVIENHKGKKSFWNHYIQSLPKFEPKLPWLSQLEEMKTFPEELQRKCERCRSNFEESWLRVKESFVEASTCSCCETLIENIVSLNSYTWAYVMVNTRGVYVEPDIVRQFSMYDMLLDEPNIALCPLMDMFNHSDSAENTVEFQHTSDGLFYKLVTLKSYEKYKQIFISYGRHDNTNLFAEYGFYLPVNENDKLKFSSNEILHILNLKVDNFQYSFLKNHEFLENDELFISYVGISFKLKGLLYVALNGYVKNYSSIIFSEKYDENFSYILKNCIRNLIKCKMKEYELDILKMEHCENMDVINFLKNKIEFVKHLEQSIDNFM